MRLARRRGLVVGMAVGAAAASHAADNKSKQQQAQQKQQTTTTVYVPVPVSANTQPQHPERHPPPQTGYPPTEYPPPVGYPGYPPDPYAYPFYSPPPPPSGYQVPTQFSPNSPGPESYPTSPGPAGVYPPASGQPYYPPTPFAVGPSSPPTYQPPTPSTHQQSTAGRSENHRKKFEKRYFHLVNESNCYVLEISRDNPNPGTSASMEKRKSDKPAHQMWYLDKDGFIRSKINDMALVTKGKNDKVRVTRFTGEPRQQWTLQGNKIINRQFCNECIGLKKGLVMVRDDADVISCQYQGKPYQHWRIEYA